MPSSNLKAKSSNRQTPPRKNRRDPLLETGFKKIDADYGLLIDCLREVLGSIGKESLIRFLDENTLSSESALDQESVQLLSITFQLLNLVEENTANQIARQRFASSGSKAISGSWIQQAATLCTPGKRCATLATHMADTLVEIVFTAHPTESKKWSILDQHRELYLNLFQLENDLYTETERQTFKEQIKSTLERLWRTGEIPSAKPDLDAERRNVLYYLGEKLPEAIHVHDQRLKQSLAAAGWSGAQPASYQALPKIHFGTWVGGDRDGHPFVTAKVTEETLASLRARAIKLLGDSLHRLSHRLPLSSQTQRLSAPFKRRLQKLRSQTTLNSRDPIAPDEPWREYATRLKTLLPGPGTSCGEHTYQRSQQLQRDLSLLAESLNDVGAQRLVESELAPLQREVDTFGFHLARLDIRQNSDYLRKAFQQLLTPTYPKIAKEFTLWSESERVSFLNEELKLTRPLANRFTPLEKEASETLSTLRKCLKTIMNHGRAGIGSFIVSMTREVSDLLIVYVLFREVGLVINWRNRPICLVPVVPLFETEADLLRSPGIIDTFLSHPVTRQSQPFWDRRLDDDIDEAWLSNPRKPSNPRRAVQQIMLGYSDSNKDCGIIASLWTVRRAQQELSLTGERHETDVQFFHGRGGTISRGAGPTHRFLDALPGGTVMAGLRLTEQGETIGQKYSNLLTASHNLELLLAGAMAAAARPAQAQSSSEWSAALDFLSQESSRIYQALLHTDGFERFFQQATPIDVLQHSRIGSRPAARTGKRSIQDMRAIPWTFSWNQARFYLPGWYGSGTALQKLQTERPEQFQQLAEWTQTIPFLRYLFFNLEASLESANLEIMQEYAALVEDRKLRSRIFNLIQSEYDLSQTFIQKLLKIPVETRRPRFYRTLHARDTGLRLLHSHQIKLLKQWRRTQKEELLNELLVVVNAIASGQRTTG